MVLEILGQVDGSHPPMPKLALEQVAVAQGFRECRRRCCQLSPTKEDTQNLAER